MARLSQDPANLAPRVVTPRASTQARRVQSINTTSDRPFTQEREVGNETIVGTTFDPSEVSVAVEANLVNARLLSLFANFDPAHTWTDKTIDTMLGNADVDIHMQQRNTARTAWLQSVYIRQATVGSYRIAASTDASATETFELSADNKTAFERFVNVDHLTAASPGQVGYTLTQTPVELTRGQKDGDFLISAQMAQPSGSSIYLLETDDYTVSGTTVSISNADIVAQIATGTQFAFAYQQAGGTTPDPFQAKDTTSPAAVRGYYFIPVTITANANGQNVRGMQNIEATINFNAQKEVGMGNQAVGAFRQTPAEVTGNFTVFAEEDDLANLMIAGEESSADTDYPLESYRNDVVIKLEFKHPDTLAVLRTDVLSGVTITGDTRDVAVGQQVGKQYNFAGSTGFTWYVTKHV